MDSRGQNIPNTELQSSVPCTIALQALDIDHVLEPVLLNVRKSGVKMLLPLRLVSHKWNDAIVKILEETHDKSFTKYFRMWGRTEKLPHEKEAMAIEELDDAIMTFSSTAACLKFSRVQFDYVYFMTNNLLHRLNLYTEIQGQLINHLTFESKYPSTNSTCDHQKCNHDEVNYEIVVLKCLGAIFKGTPNLQTLNFKLSRQLKRTRIFAAGEKILKLEKLNKIEIYEVDAQRHNDQFLQDIFRMAPNLSELTILCFESFLTFHWSTDHCMDLVKALGTPVLQIFPNLVYLKLRFLPFVRDVSAFGFLKLTTLVITSVHKFEFTYPPMTALLESVKTTLVTLKLGDTSDWVNECERWKSESVRCVSYRCHGMSGIPYPTVMEQLKTFEVNLVIFPIGCHLEESQFPVLENLKIILPIPDKFHHSNDDFKLQTQCGIPTQK